MELDIRSLSDAEVEAMGITPVASLDECVEVDSVEAFVALIEEQHAA